MAPTLEILRGCGLCSRLETQQLADVAEITKEVRLAAGEILFREGQACGGFYLVTGGAVKIYKLSPDGRERVLFIARRGHTFAEAAMFGAGVYPAFAEATEDSSLILFRRQPFLELLGKQPDLALRLFESLSLWLHRLLEEIDALSFQNARTRLANYLLQQARSVRPQGTLHGEGDPIIIDLEEKKKDLAARLGMAPETFSRCLHDLEARGWIRVDRQRIALRDPAALQELLLAGLEVLDDG